MTVALAVPAIAGTGQDCLAEDGESRAMCLAMIGAVREISRSESSQDPACASGGADDLAISYAVIDWIKAHPERQGEDLALLIREALIGLDPCVQGPLIPNPPAPDPLDAP